MFENGDIRRHHEHNRAKTIYNSKWFAFCASCSSGNDRNCRNYTCSGTCDGSHGSWLVLRACDMDQPEVAMKLDNLELHGSTSQHKWQYEQTMLLQRHRWIWWKDWCLWSSWSTAIGTATTKVTVRAAAAAATPTNRCLDGHCNYSYQHHALHCPPKFGALRTILAAVAQSCDRLDQRLQSTKDHRVWLKETQSRCCYYLNLESKAKGLNPVATKFF